MNDLVATAGHGRVPGEEAILEAARGPQSQLLGRLEPGRDRTLDAFDEQKGHGAVETVGHFELARGQHERGIGRPPEPQFLDPGIRMVIDRSEVTGNPEGEHLPRLGLQTDEKLSRPIAGLVGLIEHDPFMPDIAPAQVDVPILARREKMQALRPTGFETGVVLVRLRSRRRRGRVLLPRVGGGRLAEKRHEENQGRDGETASLLRVFFRDQRRCNVLLVTANVQRWLTAVQF